MDKKLKFDKKPNNFSSIVSKIDITNPIQFHIKNNFFYANADIIIFSQSGTEKKSQIDILEEKANYIKIKKKKDQSKLLNTLKTRQYSPVSKVKKILKGKFFQKNSIAEKKLKDSSLKNVLIKKNSSQYKSNLTLNNQKSSESRVLPKVLREKSAQELVDYFSDLSFSRKTSDKADKKFLSSFLRNRASFINCPNLRNTFNFTTLSNTNTIVNTEPTESQKVDNFNKKLMFETINDSNRVDIFGLDKGINSSSKTICHLEKKKSLEILNKKGTIVNSFYHKTNVSDESFQILDTQGDEEGSIKKVRNSPIRSLTSLGNVNITKKENIEDKVDKNVFQESINRLTLNKEEFKTYCLPERFKKTYPELVKKFRMIQDYKTNFNEKMIKNHLFQEKLEKRIDDFIQLNEKKLEESKEAFSKQDKILSDFTKQFLYKTVKKDNKKVLKNSPTFLESLRPNIELREYKDLNVIKPKFKKLGDFKLLVIPKEIKDHNKIENQKNFRDKNLTETVKNAYFKDKITNLKERRFIEKLSIPRNEPSTNRFMKGMMKTCNFIEQENIMLSNQIKKVSKKLTKRLDFITSKNAYIVTK